MPQYSIHWLVLVLALTITISPASLEMANSHVLLGGRAFSNSRAPDRVSDNRGHKVQRPVWPSGIGSDSFRGTSLGNGDENLDFLINVWSKRQPQKLEGEYDGPKPDKDENNETYLPSGEIPEAIDSDPDRIKRGFYRRLTGLLGFGVQAPLDFLHRKQRRLEFANDNLVKAMFSNGNHGDRSANRQSKSSPMVRNERKMMGSMGLLSSVLKHIKQFAPAKTNPRYIGK